MTTIDQINAWLTAREDEHVEFKEAKNSYDPEKLVNYCAALANEGGGHLILGVTDKIPRQVVGSQAFQDLPGIAQSLLQQLHLRVSAEEFPHPDGRVVVFNVPSRPVGTPIQVKGTYWMRSGESLTGMTPDVLGRIFDEAVPDYSASICPKATLADLDPTAIAEFKSRWAKKDQKPAITNLSDEQVLRDAELLLDEGLTYAALVLFGTYAALGRLLPQSEIVFEYRLNEVTGPANDRRDFRQGFFSYFDELWNAIDLRNDRQHYQDGLFMYDLPTFQEEVIREAVLNAVSHRDYRYHGSVFIRQYPRKLEIESPGGLPIGITLENIIDKQSPRNRRICDAFRRCGLVERSGQGMNRIFESCIQQSKPLPDFDGTDEHMVKIALSGVVDDPKLVRFMEKVIAEHQRSLATSHFIVVGLVHRQQLIPEKFRKAAHELLDLHILERAGRKKLILSRKFYASLGKRGVYTREKGLDRETNKALLLKHIRENHVDGSRKEELLQVLPSKSKGQVSQLLRELQKEGKIGYRGRTKAARWYSQDDPN